VRTGGLTLRLSLLAGLLVGLVVPMTASAAQLSVQRTWHGSQIHLYDAQRAGFDGHGVTVAILDGWVDTSHKDFGGRAIASADCTSGTCSTSVGKDHCGQDHGTHVAGTIASSSYGVARRARLLAIRVLKAENAGDPRSDCAGTPTMVAAGIAWAVNHGAKVINLSLGPEVALSSHTIPDAVHEAAAQGVVVVFSAGNNSDTTPQSYGGDALVVAATGPSGRLATYSQHGQGVSVAAPGGQPSSSGACSQAICVTSLFPGNQYAVAAGTSMAAPHVAGLAALLVQQRPGRGAADVMNRIEGTAHALSGAGAGLVDAAAALGVRRTTATPKATSTRSSSPKPRVVAKPKPPIKALASPSPRPSPRPTPVVTAAPVPTQPTPEPTTAPPAVLASGEDTKDEIPLPLAGIAGGLIGLAGAAVFLFGTRS
jgi:subtilisin family serine protease